MDLIATVLSRCDEAGLDHDAGRDPVETIRHAVAGSPTAAATLRSESSAPSRDLPRISVDLGGSAAGSGEVVRGPALETRDLEVIGTLGEGGMGRVLLARQHSLGRDVAVKTVRDRASEGERAALVSEGAISGSLEHPSIAPVHALGVDAEGRPALVMKCVDGTPWSQLLADSAHPAWEGRPGDVSDRLAGHLEILVQVCNAAHFAHSRRVLHRDIKPHNVMIGRYGEVMLMDWGLALRLDRQRDARPLCGSPAYMAPEMVLGQQLDVRTDVYLLGATLHQVLTGRHRHGGAALRDVLRSAALSLPFDYPESVPAELAELANRSTSLDLAQRPASAAELRQGIAEYLQHKTARLLLRSAAERVEELREMLHDEAARASDKAHRRADRLVAEAVFALHQASNEWPDDPEARTVESELEGLMAERHQRAMALERIARELDPTVFGKARGVATAAIVVVGALLSLIALLGDWTLPTPQNLLLQSFGPLGVVVVATVGWRRQMLGSEINRRCVVGSLAMTGGIAANRALGLLAGMSVSHTLLADSLLGAVIGAFCVHVLFRWLACPAVCLLISAIVCALRPDLSMVAFSLATGVGLTAGAGVAWWQTARG